MSAIDFKALATQFPSEDIEWRIGRAGEAGGKVWASALAYVTNRAIMNRLDEVCGPQNWRNEYTTGPSGGVLCGLSIYDASKAQWVTKWDGAENTDIEAVKGGLSDAMKRAGVQWGIGRYLYNLTEGWARIAPMDDKKANRGSYKDPADPNGKKHKPFRWYPPELPTWALPPKELSKELDRISASQS